MAPGRNAITTRGPRREDPATRRSPQTTPAGRVGPGATHPDPECCRPARVQGVGHLRLGPGEPRCDRPSAGGSSPPPSRRRPRPHDPTANPARGLRSPPGPANHLPVHRPVDHLSSEYRLLRQRRGSGRVRTPSDSRVASQAGSGHSEFLRIWGLIHGNPGYSGAGRREERTRTHLSLSADL